MSIKIIYDVEFKSALNLKHAIDLFLSLVNTVGAIKLNYRQLKSLSEDMDADYG